MSQAPIAAAHAYASRGLPVFPCHRPAHSGRCSCGRTDCPSPAKHPRTRRGHLDATTNPDTIETWWRRWPNANIGVRTGTGSGLVVLDIDIGHDKNGLASLHELIRRHGPLPPTPAVRTGGGGRHYWFAHPGHPLSNSAGRLGLGLDLRADGGYVIAPPSLHGSGQPYIWAAEVDLQPMPSWLLDLARTLDHQPPPTTRTGFAAPTTAWARTALHGELTRVRSAPPGTRNCTLNRSAFALGQIVGAGQLPAPAVRDALTEAGIAIGMTTAEVRATVASGLRAGIRSPRARASGRNHPHFAPGVDTV